MSLYIGLMSGTSADGADAALVDFSSGQPQLIAALATPYPEDLKARVMALYTPSENEIDRLGALDRELGLFFSHCVDKLLAKAKIPAQQITAIGSHGQTIRHRPQHQSDTAFTLQIGDPNTLAYETGIRTIADFRRKDIAAGGQGAPLTPAFHHALFSHPNHSRAVINIGGIANITCLNPKQEVIGFDTGPGNALMDAWTHLNLGKPFDRDGSWASTGSVDPALLNTFLAHSYFKLAAPKSTGREEFSFDWLLGVVKTYGPISACDVQATLLALTATTLSNAIQAHLPQGAGIYICGGGVHNTALVKALKKQLVNYPLDDTKAVGVAPNWVEAMAFAWLAQQTWQGLTGNQPAVTGAGKAVILGGVYSPG